MIENIQRRAMRLIPDLKGMTYTCTQRSVKLFSLEYRRRREDMIQLFKILNGIENIDYKSMFTFSSSTTRGHSKKLYKPQSSKGFRLNSFCVCTIDPWNGLLQKTVNSTTEWKHLQYCIEEVY